MTANSKKILSGSEDKTLRVWSMKKLRQVYYKEFFYFITCIALNNKFIFCALADKSIKVIELSTKNFITSLSGHGARVNSVLALNDQNFIISCSDDRTIRIWNIQKSFQEYFIIAHESSISNIVLNKENSLIVSSSDDCTVRVWSLLQKSREITITKVPIFQKYREPAVCSTGSADLNLLVLGFFDGSLRTWNLKLNKTCVYMNAHKDSVSHLNLNGSLLASCSADTTLIIWGLEGLAKLHVINLECILTRCVISNDFLYIVAAGYDKSIYVWSNLAKRMLIELSGHSGDVTCVQYFKSERLIASASGDSSVRLWSTDDKVQEHIFKGHRSRVNSISLDESRGLIASASFDRSVKLWHVSKRKLFRSFDEHDWGVLSVKFTKSGKYCVSTTESNIYIWRVNNL